MSERRLDPLYQGSLAGLKPRGQGGTPQHTHASVQRGGGRATWMYQICSDARRPAAGTTSPPAAPSDLSTSEGKAHRRATRRTLAVAAFSAGILSSSSSRSVEQICGHSKSVGPLWLATLRRIASSRFRGESASAPPYNRERSVGSATGGSRSLCRCSPRGWWREGKLRRAAGCSAGRSRWPLQWSRTPVAGGGGGQRCCESLQQLRATLCTQHRRSDWPSTALLPGCLLFHSQASTRDPSPGSGRSCHSADAASLTSFRRLG